MEMTHQQEQELYALCDKHWWHIRTRLDQIRLPTSADWDDIKMIAIARVFSRFGLYQPQKASLSRWARVVMQRATYNALRCYMWNKKVPSRQWRLRVSRPNHLSVKVVQDKMMFGEEVVIEPDAIDEKDWINRVLLERAEQIRHQLTPEERRLLEEIATGDPFDTIRKRVGGKLTYQGVAGRIYRLRVKCRALWAVI